MEISEAHSTLKSKLKRLAFLLKTIAFQAKMVAKEKCQLTLSGHSISSYFFAEAF